MFFKSIKLASGCLSFVAQKLIRSTKICLSFCTAAANQSLSLNQNPFRKFRPIKGTYSRSKCFPIFKSVMGKSGAAFLDTVPAA